MTTKIEWVRNPDGTKGETWNPVTGCTKVSAGCQRCYAERMARRLAGRHGYPPAPHHFDVTLRYDRLEQPLRWKKPRMIFVCSMSDLFHDDVPTPFIADLWDIMAEAYQHTFQILTKRADRLPEAFHYLAKWKNYKAPLPNVWLGVSVENQATADERIPQLLQIPAAVRFVSGEPLLGPVNITDQPWWDWRYTYDYYKIAHPSAGPLIDWLIVGGESGPGARPMHPDWARSLRDQCQAANVPFFFKQWGQFVPEDHWRQLTMKQRNRKGAVYSFDDKKFPLNQRMYSVGKRAAGRLLDGRTWDEFPERQ